jgi:hypothetical protein
MGIARTEEICSDSTAAKERAVGSFMMKEIRQTGQMRSIERYKTDDSEEVANIRPSIYSLRKMIPLLWLFLREWVASPIESSV